MVKYYSFLHFTHSFYVKFALKYYKNITFSMLNVFSKHVPSIMMNCTLQYYTTLCLPCLKLLT